RAAEASERIADLEKINHEVRGCLARAQERIESAERRQNEGEEKLEELTRTLRELGGMFDRRDDNRGRITDEMTQSARELRAIDSQPETPIRRFSRRCTICFTEHPRQRAAFDRCGHIVCFPCAVDHCVASGPSCVICR
ncbi:hypothetical protein PFISCL1PPCAC_11707, partial [Pristionchus fissidentatus]